MRTKIFLDVLNNNKTPAGCCIDRTVDAILAEGIVFDVRTSANQETDHDIKRVG